jgi:MFS family permease
MYQIKLRDFTLLVSSMITIIGTTAIAASLPQMSQAYVSVPDAQFLVRVSLTLPALSIALFAPFMGAIIDRWGRKNLFIASMILYGLSGISGFFLASLYQILITRFILGISVAGITICATALISDFYQGMQLSRFMGQQSLFMGLGNVVFVSLGGILADYNWRLPFMIYSIAFFILPGVIFLITEPFSKSYADNILSNSETTPIAVKKTLFVYFIGFINMVVYFMIPVYLPFYLESFKNITNTRVGLLLSIVGLSWGTLSSQYHRFKKILTFEQIAIVTFILMGIAHLILSSATGYLMVIIALILNGIGLGVFIPNLNAWLLSFVPASMKGRVIGGLVFFVFLGQFFSPIITRPLDIAAGISKSYFIAGVLLLCISLGYAVFKFRQSVKRRMKAQAEQAL